MIDLTEVPTKKLLDEVARRCDMRFAAVTTTFPDVDDSGVEIPSWAAPVLCAVAHVAKITPQQLVTDRTRAQAAVDARDTAIAMLREITWASHARIASIWRRDIGTITASLSRTQKKVLEGHKIAEMIKMATRRYRDQIAQGAAACGKSSESAPSGETA